MKKYYLKDGIIYFSIFKNHKEIKAGFSTKLLHDPGYSNKDNTDRQNNIKKIFSVSKLDFRNAVFQNQEHTANITIVNSDYKKRGLKQKSDAIQNNDGMITNEKNLILTAWGADCTSVYLFDEKKKVIALLHSGREGTRKNIVKNAVEILKKSFHSNPKDIIAVLGPGICGNCYKINEDIAKEFEEIFLFRKNNDVFLDVKKKIVSQLMEMGVEQIEDVNICTKCDERFYSYRREGKNHGSGMAFISLI